MPADMGLNYWHYTIINYAAKGDANIDYAKL